MLETVKQQIQRLIAVYESERKERERLQDELEQTKLQNIAYQKRISELEKQIDNYKLTEAFVVSGTNNTEAKKKIDSIIKEIDKCIALVEG